MVYWLLFLILLILSIREIRYRCINKKSFLFMYLIMTFMIVFRKGQGTDYFNYSDIYMAFGDNATLILSDSVLEPLYVLLNYYGNILHIKYHWFSALVALVTMVLLYRFFARSCNKSIFALFIFYCTWFFVYPYSAIRQGLALGIVLGIAWPLLQRGRVVLFSVMVIVASMFHLSAMCCLLYPFAKFISNKLITVTILPLLCMALFQVSIFDSVDLGIFEERTDGYINDGSTFRFISFLSKVAFLVPIFFLSWRRYATNPQLRLIRGYLFMGFAFYCILSFAELVASRIWIYYYAFFPLFMTRFEFVSYVRSKMRYCSYVLLLCSIFLYKDINGFISQAEYKNCNTFTYPYLNMTDSNSDISYYRKDAR